jgi:hypothetical protein
MTCMFYVRIAEASFQAVNLRLYISAMPFDSLNGAIEPLKLQLFNTVRISAI